MKRRTLLGLGGAAVVALAAGGIFLSMPASQAETKIFRGETPGIAINGYDPVAYFTEGKPVEGTADHNLEWQGVRWQFASAENRDLFEADPDKYAPQYGGYCAYAAAKNQIAKTEPDAWSIVDGKLYLNFDRNIKATWDGNKSEFIQQADRNWPALSAKGS